MIEELAEAAGINQRATHVTEAQLRVAAEILLSGAARELSAVTALDGTAVGSGRPGQLFRRLRDAFDRYKVELAGEPW